MCAFLAAVGDDQDAYLRGDLVDPAVEDARHLDVKPEFLRNLTNDADFRRLSRFELPPRQLPLCAFVLEENNTRVAYGGVGRTIPPNKHTGEDFLATGRASLRRGPQRMPEHCGREQLGRLSEPYPIIVAGAEPRRMLRVPVERILLPQLAKIDIRVVEDLGSKQIIMHGCFPLLPSTPNGP